MDRISLSCLSSSPNIDQILSLIVVKTLTSRGFIIIFSTSLGLVGFGTSYSELSSLKLRLICGGISKMSDLLIIDATELTFSSAAPKYPLAVLGKGSGGLHGGKLICSGKLFRLMTLNRLRLLLLVALSGSSLTFFGGGQSLDENAFEADFFSFSNCLELSVDITETASCVVLKTVHIKSFIAHLRVFIVILCASIVSLPSKEPLPFGLQFAGFL